MNQPLQTQEQFNDEDTEAHTYLRPDPLGYRVTVDVFLPRDAGRAETLYRELTAFLQERGYE